MERNKNILIGGLLAIVLVMAVGYAAFATQLNINGTAEITSKWDIHFDNTKTHSVDGVVTPTIGLTGAVAPSGTVSYDTAATTATLNATLNQPGDKVLFTLTIVNAGNLDAVAATPVLSGDGLTVEGLTATSAGHIKFTVTSPTPATIGENDTATMTVLAEFTDVALNEVVNQETATLNVTVNYSQSTAQAGA